MSFASRETDLLSDVHCNEEKFGVCAGGIFAVRCRLFLVLAAQLPNFLTVPKVPCGIDVVRKESRLGLCTLPVEVGPAPKGRETK